MNHEELLCQLPLSPLLNGGTKSLQHATRDSAHLEDKSMNETHENMQTSSSEFAVAWKVAEFSLPLCLPSLRKTVHRSGPIIHPVEDMSRITGERCCQCRMDVETYMITAPFSTDSRFNQWKRSSLATTSSDTATSSRRRILKGRMSAKKI